MKCIPTNPTEAAFDDLNKMPDKNDEKSLYLCQYVPRQILYLRLRLHLPKESEAPSEAWRALLSEDPNDNLWPYSFELIYHSELSFSNLKEELTPCLDIIISVGNINHLHCQDTNHFIFDFLFQMYIQSSYNQTINSL